MSVIRINSLANVVCVPRADGVHVASPYDEALRTGRIIALPTPDDEQIGTIDALGARLIGHLAKVVPPAAAALPPGGTVTVMVHGFLFDPTDVRPDRSVTDNPHRLIFHFDKLKPAFEASHHATAWPLHLGFRPDDHGEGGLVVAFGWNSGTKLAAYHDAYVTARLAGWPLLCVLQGIAKALPIGSRIQILCHSLGSVVVLRAIEMAAARRLPVTRTIERVVILGGSVTRFNTQSTANAILGFEEDGGLPLPGGPTFYNIMSNDDFVLSLFAKGFTPTVAGVATIPIGSFGFPAGRLGRRWINLRLDDPGFAKWARTIHGLDVRGDDPDEMLDHWVYYTHLPNLGIYRPVLRSAPEWSLAALRRGPRPIPEE